MTSPDFPQGDRFIVVLVAVTDPSAGHGSPTRSSTYRLRLALKCLLRGFGLKCVRVTPGGPAASGDAPQRPITSA